MEEGRILRPKGKGRNEQVNRTIATITTETTTTTNTVQPLMSIPIPRPTVSAQPAAIEQVPIQQAAPLQTITFSDPDCTMTSPQYSSATAQEVRRQYRTLQLSERVDANETVINNAGLTLREYVSASVGASQAAVMNLVKESLQQMVPQIVRESMRAERNFSFGSFDQTSNQPANYDHYQRRQSEVHNTTQLQHEQMALPTNHLHPRQQQPSDLEKWGIKFDGSRKSFTVEDFVFRVESLQVDYNCSMTTLMKGFHHLLSGSAYEWFWTFRRENPYCEWAQLKFNLIRKFRRFESDTEIQRCIMERRQNSSESSEAYLGDIISLKNQLNHSMREEELVKIVKDNLKDGLYQLIYPISIRTFDHLLDECRRAERNIAKRNHIRQFSRTINEIENNTMEEDSQKNVEAFKITPAAKQLVCWNCKTPGHIFFDCISEQRNLFCYKCGFEGVITPKCPKCTGNK